MSSDPDAVLSPAAAKQRKKKALMTTPSPSSTEDGDAFDVDFSDHAFYGPVPNDPNGRVKHTLRKLGDDTPPKFVSRSSELDVSEGSQLREESVLGNMIEVIFPEEKLGFGTKMECDDDSGLVNKVQVEYVDASSPAAIAGVSKDDFLISVNTEPVQSGMTQDQVVELIKNATLPKNMLFLRISEDTSPSKAPKKLARAKSYSLLKGKMLKRLQSNKTLQQGLQRTGTLQRLQTARKIVDSALGRNAGKVHEDSFCDGCGISPIVGILWTCSVCTDFNLCPVCYDRGVHGLENKAEMKLFDEATIQYKLKSRCKRFDNAFLLALRRDICKERLDKYEYMGSWLADIVGGTAATRITVRGIEIPQLTPSARGHFVGMLMPLASNRTDIEVNIEWLGDEKSPEGEDMEKLRIWISDKKSRTKSPFAA